MKGRSFYKAKLWLRQPALLMSHLKSLFLSTPINDCGFLDGGTHGPVGHPLVIKVCKAFIVEFPFVAIFSDVFDKFNK